MSQLPIYGQPVEPLPTFTLRHYTGENGLADNKLIFFFRHPNGFCWATSPTELMRFDGYRFNTFARDLPPIVAASFNHRGEIVLLHSDNNLDYTLFNPENKQARRLNVSAERLLRDTVVWTSLQDTLVWAVARSSSGLRIYQVGVANKPREMDFLSHVPFQPGRGIDHLAFSKSELVYWYYQPSSGLCRRDYAQRSTQVFRHYFDGKKNQPLPAGQAQIVLKQGKVPVVSFRNSPILLHFDEKTGEFKQWATLPGSKSAHLLAIDPLGNCVVSSAPNDNKNIWLWRAVARKWVDLSPVLGKFSIRQISGDDFNRQVTAATLEGLVQINFYRPLFQTLLPEGKFVKSGIFETRGIAADPRTGKIVVMGEQYGIFLVDEKLKKLEHLPLEVEGSTGKRWHAAPNVGVAFDEQGYLWVPLVRPDSNLARVNLTTRRATVWEVPGKMSVRAMMRARDGNIWLAASNAYDNAIYCFNPRSNTFSMAASAGVHPELKNNTPYFLLESRSGNIWLGGTRGLKLFDPASGKFLKYAGEENCEQNFTVSAIAEGTGNQLLVGTLGNGLHILNTQTGQCEVYQTADGLAGNDKIAGILPQPDGNCWVSTYDGLSFLHRKSNGAVSFINFSKKDGLTHNEFNRFSYYTSADGRMFLGGLFGVNVFFPDTLISHFDLNSAPVLLSHYARLNEEARATEIDTGLGRIDSIVIPASNRAITFRFALANYWQPEKNRFRYRIEGLGNHNAWQVMADNSRQITINYLPAGNYKLRVQGATSYGVWSDDERVIALHVEELWYKTDLAFITYTLLLGVGILLFNRYQRKRRWEQIVLQQKERELEHEQRHARHLEKLNEAFARFVPHDFLKRLGYQSVLDTRLGDQIQTRMTILFADIRNWTTISEKMKPADNFNFINVYLNRVGPVIRQHGGFVNQYLGDGIMALFPESPADALRAAVHMQQAIATLNEENINQRHLPQIQVGIGLHTGTLMLGVLGDQHRYDTGVISDAVNTAARIEGLTKIFSAQILASAETLRGAPDVPYLQQRFLGKIQVKGKAEPLDVFEIFGETALRSNVQHRKEANALFQKGLTLYFERKFSQAAREFAAALAIDPDDAAAQFYLLQSEKHIEYPPGQEWSGVEMMSEK